MIMLSVAIGRAVSLGFNAVAFGAHGGANDVMYPDCSPEFASAMNAVGHLSDEKPISILAPFVAWEKPDIVKRGFEINVPFDKAWSCHGGNYLPCETCGTCVGRIEVFGILGRVDPLKARR